MESPIVLSVITAIIVAVVALISTVIGATIGAVTNYVLAVRRENAENVRDSRVHAIEVQRAARLIDAELLRAHAAAAICVEKRHWWSRDVQPLSGEAWKKYNHIIAADLSDPVWHQVIIAIEAVDHISSARDIARDSRLEAGLPISSAISDEEAEQLAPMLRDIRAGRDALATFMLDSRDQPSNQAMQRTAGRSAF